MIHSLRGLRVLNTRPKDQAQALSAQIQEAGGVSIELPTIEIKEKAYWQEQLPDLTKIQQAIFVSANAVIHCLKYIARWPTTIKVIAIGKSTAKALTEHQILVQAIPEIAESEYLLALSSLKFPQGQNILLVKGEGGRTLIEETLREKGANLIALSVYQREIPQINQQFIKSIWRDDLVDIILLTSEQSMHHLFMLFGEEAHHWLRQKTGLVLSERLVQTAASLGMNHVILSHPEKIMNTLFDYVNKD